MTDKLICEDCKKSRRTSGGRLICVGIGDPLLVYKYGKCRRFEQRSETTKNKQA